MENPPFQRYLGASTIPEIPESRQISGNTDSTETLSPRNISPQKLFPEKLFPEKFKFLGEKFLGGKFLFSKDLARGNPGIQTNLGKSGFYGNSSRQKHFPRETFPRVFFSARRISFSGECLSGKSLCFQKGFACGDLPEIIVLSGFPRFANKKSRISRIF